MPALPVPLVAVRADRGWVGPAVAISLAATILGLSRFGYGVLLPPMRADLHWSYAQAGLLDTGNAADYLAGDLACSLLVVRVGDTATLRLCAGLTAASLLGCAATEHLPALLVLRAVGGTSAAALFVAGGLVVAPHCSRRWCSPSPADGRPAGSRSGCWPPAARCSPVATPPAVERRGRRLRCALVAFALFGIGYVPYTTFAVAYWQQNGAGTALVTTLWGLIAVATTASGLLWRRLRTRHRRALVVLLAVVTAGVALPLASTPVLAACAALFGSGFLAVSAATMALIRDTRPHPEWSRTLANLHRRVRRRTSRRPGRGRPPARRPRRTARRPRRGRRCPGPGHRRRMAAAHAHAAHAHRVGIPPPDRGGLIDVATLLYLLILAVFPTALGRSATPPAERLPWRTWAWRALAANLAQGVRVLCEPNERQRHLWDVYLNELQPWRRRNETPRNGPEGEDSSSRCPGTGCCR